MKKIFFLVLFVFNATLFQVSAQVAITQPDSSFPAHSSAMLDVRSTTRGFLPPRMTSSQRKGIASPANGLLTFDATTNSIWTFKTGGWKEIGFLNQAHSDSVNSPNAFPNAAFRFVNSNNASGGTGMFFQPDSLNNGSALSAVSKGTGNAFRAEVDRNTATAVFGHATDKSLGLAGKFMNDNAANTSPAVTISTNAANAAAHALTVSTSGEANAGRFSVTSPTSTSSAVWGSTTGDGYAATFINTKNNASNSGAVIAVTDADSGSGYPNVIFAQANGALGTAGFFYSQNANNVRPTMIVRNDGGERTMIVSATNATNAANAVDVRSKGTADSRALSVTHEGLGVGAEVLSTNTLNNNDAVSVTQSGTAAALRAINNNLGGNGTAGIFTKNTSYGGAYTAQPECDLEVRHRNQAHSGMSGLRILNTSNNQESWTLYTNDSDGSLSFFHKNTEASYITSTGVFTTPSDQRLKANITAMPPLLEKVMQLAPKSYHYISDKTQRPMLGFLAQDVEQVFPNIVYKNTTDAQTGLYKMDYSAFGVIAVKAVQEQQKIIQDLQSQINELKKQNAEIMEMIRKK